MHPFARVLLLVSGGMIEAASHAATDVPPSAQGAAVYAPATPSPTTAADPNGSGTAYRPVDWRTGAVVAAGLAGVAAYGMTHWWQEGFSGRFRTVDEHWFSRRTESGGADKLGHAYSTYAGTRGLSWTFQVLGHDPETARRLGVATTLISFTGVEIADGFSRKYRFSKEDVLMNVGGAALGYVMERYPGLDELVDFRLLYRRSKIGSRRSGWDPAGDYSGQTYLLAFKASGVPALRERPVLRYLELAVGYRARGFERDQGRLLDPGAARRDTYVGVSLNLSRLLNDTVFAHRQGSWDQRLTSGLLEVVQVPGTAALHHERL
jgi:hypothetical protein